MKMNKTQFLTLITKPIIQAVQAEHAQPNSGASYPARVMKRLDGNLELDAFFTLLKYAGNVAFDRGDEEALCICQKLDFKAWSEVG